jgi:chromate transporter
MIYLELFWTFIQIGAFSFGGGYAVLPMIQKYVVEQQQWITMTELADITSISQMTPGPIAINAATFVGVKVAGVGGGVIATIGCILPSFILLIVLAYYFFKNSNLNFIQNILKGLRPAIVSLIALAAISLTLIAFWISPQADLLSVDNLNLSGIVSAAVSLVLLIKFKTDTIGVIAMGAIIGIIIYFI